MTLVDKIHPYLGPLWWWVSPALFCLNYSANFISTIIIASATKKVQQDYEFHLGEKPAEEAISWWLMWHPLTCCSIPFWKDFASHCLKCLHEEFQYKQWRWTMTYGFNSPHWSTDLSCRVVRKQQKHDMISIVNAFKNKLQVLSTNLQCQDIHHF